MKRFALIGHPVAGSLSPVLFDAAYSGRYPYDLIDAPFHDAWDLFLSSYDGINITAPYKQDAFAAVDWLSPTAKACGAVNLVVKDSGVLRGYNTDVDGIVGAVGKAFDNVLIIGAGGAARAAVAAAQVLGCKHITVVNRTYEKAVALASAFGCSALEVSELDSLSPSLVIYTVPGDPRPEAGMTPFVFPGLTGGLLRNAVVLEAEYKHPVLSSVPCKAYISGKSWLLHQAIAGYELFTGEKPNAQAMRERLAWR